MTQSQAGLTHLDETGAANMVDVADKAMTSREAVATGCVKMAPETLALIRSGDAKKAMCWARRVWQALWPPNGPMN